MQSKDYYTKEGVTAMLNELTAHFAWMHGQKAIELDPPDETVEEWLSVLEEMQVDDIKLAKSLTKRTMRFMPAPQEFIELVHGSDEAVALQEWIIICQALRLSASDRPAIIETLSPHAKLALHSMGGTALLAETKTESLYSSTRTHFINTWKSFKKGSKWRESAALQELVKPTSQYVLAPAVAPIFQEQEPAEMTLEGKEYAKSILESLINASNEKKAQKARLWNL